MRQTVPVRLLALVTVAMLLAGCVAVSEATPDTAEPGATVDGEPPVPADAPAVDLARLCEDRVGLPIHSLDDFSDDFWGEVYKAEVRAARGEWLYFCGTVLPDYGVIVCDHLLEDSNALADSQHDRVMSAMADRSLHLCDAVFETLGY